MTGLFQRLALLAAFLFCACMIIYGGRQSKEPMLLPVDLVPMVVETLVFAGGNRTGYRDQDRPTAVSSGDNLAARSLSWN